MVGAAIAQALGCPHQVVVVKKIGFPGREELAIGAITEDGTLIRSQDIASSPDLDRYVEQKKETLKAKIKVSIKQFRQGNSLDLQAKTVILVDDGVATGETMKAAVVWGTTKEPSQRPDKVLMAVPVCSPPAAKELVELADKLVCIAIPHQFWAVGQFYWDFDPVSDDHVL